MALSNVIGFKNLRSASLSGSKLRGGFLETECGLYTQLTLLAEHETNHLRALETLVFLVRGER